MEFIEAYQNLFLKKEDPAKSDSAEFDGLVYNLNRYLSMDDIFLIPVAQLTRYLSVLRGRYYHLLYTMIPDLGRKVYTKWVKSTVLSDQERVEVEAISRLYGMNMRNGYMARRVLLHKGIDVKAMIGTVAVKEKKEKKNGKK